MEDDYLKWLSNHTHKYDEDGYCDLCGFHKDTFLIESGIYKEEQDIGELNGKT